MLADDQHAAIPPRPTNPQHGSSNEASPEAERDYSQELTLSQAADATPSEHSPDPTAGLAPPRAPVRLGRYVAKRLLGRGGFGAVYLARDEQLDRDVAIKTTLQSESLSAGDIAKIVQEARTVARLKHPGIVAVYDVGQADDGRPYVVMQYVNGPTLRERMRADHETRDAGRSAAMMAAIAEAVAYAHKQGLVHRDLKPANILLDGENHPLVADFGLAIAEQAMSRHAGELAGTPPYMSPEQVEGDIHRIDGRADIWSLGVILYELLTGRLPFLGDGRDEILDSILRREPRPPRMIDETIPRELERIVLKCLRKNLTERYSSALDLAADLRAWSGPRSRTSRLAVASLVAVGALAVAGAAWRWMSPSEPISATSGSSIDSETASAESQLAALIAELRDLRSDLGEEKAKPAQLGAVAPGNELSDKDADAIPLPAGFAEIEARLAKARESGNRDEEDSALLKATNDLVEAGHYAIAERLARRMVKLAEGDVGDGAIAYGQLGLAQYRQGKHAEAIASYQHAELIYRGIFDKLMKLPESEQVLEFRSSMARLLGLTLMRMGNVHKSASATDKARLAYQDALTVFEQHDRRAEMITLLLNYGGMESERGQYDVAIGLLERALRFAKEEQDTEDIASCLVNLGNTYSRQSNELKAIELYQEARQFVTPQSSYSLRSALIVNWVGSLLQEGRRAEALVLLEELELFVRPEDGDARRVLDFLPILRRARDAQSSKA